MKKIILLNGSGLMNYSELGFLFDGPNVKFEVLEINPFSTEPSRFTDLECDGLIFGSPYYFGPEESLMVRLLTRKIAPLLDHCWQKGTKVLALGRGTLIFWEWLLADQWKRWKPFELSGVSDPFVDCELYLGGEWKNLKCGRLSSDAIIPDESDFNEWEIFIKNSGNTLGWLTRSFYLSLVDVLAFMNAAQLDNYGYTSDVQAKEFASIVIEDIFKIK